MPGRFVSPCFLGEPFGTDAVDGVVSCPLVRVYGQQVLYFKLSGGGVGVVLTPSREFF